MPFKYDPEEMEEARQRHIANEGDNAWNDNPDGCWNCGGDHHTDCCPYPEEPLDYSFRDPGGRSALRSGKREFPCPTCGRPNMLTAADVQLHYQCDYCADAAEGRLGGEY